MSIRKSLLFLACLLSFASLNILFSSKVFAYPLTPQIPISLGGDMHLVKIEDMDNDGNNDIIVTDGKVIKGFAILFGNGNGTFSAPLLVGDGDPYEWGLAIADMNNDGLKDVITANGSLDVVQVSINNGFRSFRPSVNYAIGDDIYSESSLVAADFNGDGNNDIAVAGGASTAFSVFLGDGNGGLSSPTAVAANDPQFFHSDIEIIDFNGDSILDLITTDPGPSGDIEFFAGVGDGSFTYDHSIADVPADSFSLADIDGDGVKDIVYSQSSTGVFVIKQDGTPITSFLSSSAELVETSDINLDGNIDIVFSDNSVTGIQVAISTGGGTFDPLVPYTVSFSPLGIGFGDLDNDGLPDVAAVNHGDVLSVFLTDPPKNPDILINNSTHPVTAEGGASGYFDIVLTSNPSDVVIVEFSSNNSQIEFPKGGVCFVPSGQSINPGTPYDPCTTWNVGQTVEINAIDDADVEGTHSDEIVFSVNGGGDTDYSSLTKPNLPVTVYDNEIPPTPQINYSTSAGASQPADVSEDGAQDRIELSLEGIPAYNVTVSCTPSVAGQVVFDPDPIVFVYTPLTANLPRTIDVSAVDDALVEGDHSISLNCTTASSDRNYDGLSLSIPVNIADNDSSVTPPVDPTDGSQAESSNANSGSTLASTGQNSSKIIASSLALLCLSLLLSTVYVLKLSDRR
jgi:hypothetical protein